jgi:dihydrodipicolinate synthase/N-acetylneuraminate lyase
VKAACRLAGTETGPVRAPLLPLDDAALGDLRALLGRVALEPSA